MVMKEIREVLEAREQELARVRHEVDSLRLVAPLLAEDGDDVGKKAVTATAPFDAQADLAATGTDPLFGSIHDSGSFWNAFKWRK
jgi:hypothetical protein